MLQDGGGDARKHLGTPVFSRPLALGLDVVVYSASNYICGHSDCMMGVTLPRGSEHDAMSTPDRVRQAGDDSFLKCIAIDPEAPDPGRARWFSLDDPVTKARLKARPLCCPLDRASRHDSRGGAYAEAAPIAGVQITRRERAIYAQSTQKC
ncbi:MAG: PLP-dependent transferase [Pseudomonadota bacterium]